MGTWSAISWTAAPATAAGSCPEKVTSAALGAAPSAALVTFSGHRPADVAGAAVEEIALHVPKTTDLTVAATAVRALGDRLRA